MTRALILVDVQNDFCPGGSLATEQGSLVADRIGKHQLSHRADYDAVVATQDWHIDPGAHFSENPDYVDSWPVHCVADSPGSQLHPLIKAELIDEFFHKGEYDAAYSGFESHSVTDGSSLGDWLRARKIEQLDVAGIATDYCVRATVLDALKEGFSVRLLTSLCSPVSQETGAAAIAEMEQQGAELA